MTTIIRIFRPMLSIAALLLFLSCPPDAQARTYIITDGDRCFTYISPSPAQAEEENTATICRSPEIYLSYRGNKTTVSSTEKTVGDLLDHLGLEVTPCDTLSHHPDTAVYDGMELTVTHEITREETYTVTASHETTYCADASLPEGIQEVLIEGRDGELIRSAEVTYRNGIEVARNLVLEKQSIAPITEVIALGTGKSITEKARDMPIIEDGYIIMPSGEILTYYKTDNVTATGYTHTDAGCDMITSTGTTVHYGTVAVDPRFIPYGTRMLIVSHDGKRYYGIATAEDCGGAIKRDKMDLYFPTYQECIDFGRRRCTIYFLG